MDVYGSLVGSPPHHHRMVVVFVIVVIIMLLCHHHRLKYYPQVVRDTLHVHLANPVGFSFAPFRIGG